MPAGQGRCFVELDPDGYDWCKEPGFHHELDGGAFAKSLTPDGKTPYPHNFFCPDPLLGWVLPKPRQFDAGFYRDARMADHVIPKSLWTFAAGVTAREFELSKKADGTSYPANKWVQISKIAAGTVSLDSTHYGNLAAASGVSMANMRTVAVTATTPVGASLTDAGLFTPMLQWSLPPPPDDYLVFGWSHFAMVLHRGSVVLCYSPLNDRQTWRKIASFGRVTSRGGYNNPLWLEEMHDDFAIPDLQIALRMCKVILVGFNHIACYLNQGPANLVKLAEHTQATLLWPPGGWWIGAPTGGRFFYQCQVMGYEVADTAEFTSPASPLIHFELAQDYLPTALPQRAVDALVHASFPSDISTADLGGIVTYNSAATGNELQFGIRDESDNPWIFTGAHRKGGWRLRLAPSTPGGLGGAYLAPQFRHGDLRFPMVLEPRPNTPLVIADTDWRRWHAEVSLREPNGKRLEVDLKQTGAAAFYAAGFHRRSSYPIHITQDTNGDGIPDTIRVRAWVRKSKLTKHLVPDDSGIGTIQAFRLEAKGLLDRADRKPSYLPELVDPSGGGKITHRYAASEALASSGMDPTVSAYVSIAADPLTGTGWDLLPATWGLDTGEAGSKTKSWKPGWDETWLAYLERLATQLVGWVIYEGLSTIRYHPDLQFDLAAAGRSYFPIAYVYRNQANAEGAGLPGQAYLANSEEEQQDPLCNRVRVVGKENANRLAAWILETYNPALTDTTDENFTGEPLVLDLEPENDASEGDLRRVAKVALIQGHRRLFLPSFEVMLAPWDIHGDEETDAGAVLTFQAEGRSHLIAHLEVEQLTSRNAGSIFKTRLVGETLPPGALLGVGIGAYPGAGVPL